MQIVLKNCLVPHVKSGLQQSAIVAFPHTVPHDPQLSTDNKLVHTVAGEVQHAQGPTVNGLLTPLQEHKPDTQVEFDGHTFPLDPQLFASESNGEEVSGIEFLRVKKVRERSPISKKQKNDKDTYKFVLISSVLKAINK